METLEVGSPSMFKDGSESLLGCLEPGGLGLEVEETRNFVKEFGWESVDVVLVVPWFSVGLVGSQRVLP